MENLEIDLREKIVKTLLVLAILCMLLDVSFLFLFLFTSGIDVPVYVYVLSKICLPFSLNLMSYFVARYINKSERYSNDFKNKACSYALCTTAGVMAVLHSFYSQLWVVPCMVLLFCSVFHNPKINRGILIYCCLIIVGAVVYISIEVPGPYKDYIFEGIVAEGITFLASLVAKQVQKYQYKVQKLILKTLENEEKYRQRLEYDSLTKVHSRVYIREIVNKLFGLKDTSNPLGLAIIDLDNFKSINDTYGHDNGDVVLRALGGLLNEYATDEIIVGRFGGEEFVIIFKGENTEEYYTILDKIREEFSKYSFDFMDKKLSFSSGLVKCNSNTIYEKAFNQADKALYVSKNEGKNRITMVEL